MTLRIPLPAKNSEFLNVAFQAVIFLRNCKTRNFADFLVNIDFKILKNRFFCPTMNLSHWVVWVALQKTVPIGSAILTVISYQQTWRTNKPNLCVEEIDKLTWCCRLYLLLQLRSHGLKRFHEYLNKIRDYRELYNSKSIISKLKWSDWLGISSWTKSAEFEPRLKFETWLKLGWFHFKLYILNSLNSASVLECNSRNHLILVRRLNIILAEGPGVARGKRKNFKSIFF